MFNDEWRWIVTTEKSLVLRKVTKLGETENENEYAYDWLGVGHSEGIRAFSCFGREG